MAHILVIDDDKSLREVVRFILEDAGHEVTVAGDGQSGLALLDTEIDLVMTDVKMPGIDGLEVLRRVVAESGSQPPPVIVLTAHGTVEQAVEAMQLGAYTYLLKPFARDELRLTVNQALHLQDLEQDNRRLRGLLEEKSRQSGLIFRSDRMQTMLEDLRQAAASDATILITGESGTGKELVARACHDLSGRWDQPFVAVNCAAMPGELMESELFGHAKGAFTGANRASLGRIRAAHGGTLFLDEIGELPVSLQPKLLRVLEERTVDPVGTTRPIAVDFRLVCATNRNLEEEAAAGRFREDLLFRINVLQLDLPALRERPDDIGLLWDHFSTLHNGTPLASDDDLKAELEGRIWRGNVRELKNLNQRLVLLRRGEELTRADLARLAPDAGASSAARSPGETTAAGMPDGSVGGPENEKLGPGTQGLPLTALPDEGFSLLEMEKEIIRLALEKNGGNRTRAAAYLGIARHILVYRLDKYGLS